jgi:hypothetical protein
MVNRQQQDSGRRRANQGVRDVIPEPNKINASTPYDFNGKNLTPYGGLLPVITMLEKLGFQPLVEETVSSKRIPRAAAGASFCRLTKRDPTRQLRRRSGLASSLKPTLWLRDGWRGRSAARSTFLPGMYDPAKFEAR